MDRLSRNGKRSRSPRLALLLLAPLVLSACSKHEEAAAPEARPVRTVTVEKTEGGTPITMTGRIEAKDEVNLAFRIAGRLLESTLRQGDRVEAGQVVARLEPQNEQNAAALGRKPRLRRRRPRSPRRRITSTVRTRCFARAGPRAPTTIRR